MFLLHVLLFEGFKTSKLPIFKLETLTFPLFSPCSPFSWATLQAQSAGIPAISNTLEYWGGNMWGIWMIDPPLPLHPLPLSLLSVTCWGGGEGHWRPGCLDEVITEYQWQWEGRPTDLWGDVSWAKTRGLRCVRWLMSCGVGRFSSKSWPPRWRTCPKCPHDVNKRFLSEYCCHFETHLVSC